MKSPGSSARAFVLLILSLCCLIQSSVQEEYIRAQDAAGNQIYLEDSRRPALFTRNFGDCLGSSTINVTRFDVAYYKDNMTVLFHLGGNTGVHNESLMMHIGVFAYGEARFDLTFNPCNANIESLCPMRARIPIEANGIIPIAPSDVSGIPSIALAIPDFEGIAVLRIYANSTQTEIGCYSAVVTNGATFSQPAVVGTVLGIFTAVAVLASFVTTIYGESVPTIRNHYAHSLSVSVVFAVLQSIFFTGALSVNWPSVLSAFWSNFAWSGGMIYSERMQNSINAFLGSNLGNTSAVGAAGSGSPSSELGGGVRIQSIYRRALIAARAMTGEDAGQLKMRDVEKYLSRRDLINATSGYAWYGQPVKPGMPLPGNFSGFAGTLSAESIPASNAFMTGLLWTLIVLAIVIGSVSAFKWLLEGLSRCQLVKRDRLALFRARWLTYTGLAVLRALFIAFFMLIFLTLFQSAYKGTAGVTAIAAIVFIIIFVGTLAAAGYACFYRLRFGHYESEPDRVFIRQSRVWKIIPWVTMIRESQQRGKAMLDDSTSDNKSIGSVRWWTVRYIDHDPQRVSIHEDVEYASKFGWLASRFRRTRWWFFAVWLIYEFIRACFYGGAAEHPKTQVFGLLIVEILAFIGLIVLKPFEGHRLNVLIVYLLGMSKILVTGLSASFITSFNLARIPATIVGVLIIVIQGVLTVVLLIAIVVGSISSYMSLTRNREDFKPKSWAGMRTKYFTHMEKRAADLPPEQKPKPEVPVEPCFHVSAVRRCPKIEDEDLDFVAEINDPSASRVSVNRPFTRTSRRSSVGANSVATFTTVPWGARVHRASWSTREFETMAEHTDKVGNGTRPTTRGSIAHFDNAGPSASTTSLSQTRPK